MSGYKLIGKIKFFGSCWVCKILACEFLDLYGYSTAFLGSQDGMLFEINHRQYLPTNNNSDISSYGEFDVDVLTIIFILADRISL